MNIVLLSGGSGKRLWPLSNDIRSKQFIKIFRRPDGSRESMVQRMVRGIRQADENAVITIATSKSQISSLHHQLGEDIRISVEPCRRDTFPAIVLSCYYLRDVAGVPEEEAVVICPVDPYVDETYFTALKALYDLAGSEQAHLNLIGMEPTYPSEKYGYILPESSEPVSRVLAFKEKPNAADAQAYIQKGALWNGGVFGFRLGYLLELAKKLLPYEGYEELLLHYEELPKISFDYAVAEKEESILVMRFAGEWKDLGTWNTLTEAMDEQVLGDALLDESSSGVHIINESGLPIVAMGLHDVVISAGPDGILVADKGQSSYLKPLVDQLDRRIMFAEKSWGSFRVLDVDSSSMTIKVTLNPGHRMNYHSHQHRDEVWVVVSGEGRTLVDGMEQKIRPGDVVTMQAGTRHTVMADTALQLIEVQLGEDINVQDKQKYPL